MRGVLRPAVRVRSLFGWRSLWPSAADVDVTPLALLDADRPLIRGWRAVSDGEYEGGRSGCVTRTDAQGVHFSGEVRAPEGGRISRGFCAVRGACRAPVDLRDHQGVRVRIHSAGPLTIALNMKCVSYFKDDLFQLFLALKEGPNELHVPFSAFRLTARGRERELQRANDFLLCEGMGLLVTEANSKKPVIPFFHFSYYTCFRVEPFDLVLESIVAVPILDEKTQREFRRFEPKEDPAPSLEVASPSS